jgi:hypothetical protein
MRTFGAAALASLLAGCPLATPDLLDGRFSEGRPASAEIALSIRLEGTSSAVDRIQVSVAGSAGQPLLRRYVPAEELRDSALAMQLENLPAGSVTLQVEALDAQGNRLARTIHERVLDPGQRPGVALTLNLEESAEPEAPAPSGPTDRTHPGPMVFSPGTAMGYQLKALNDWMPLGDLSLQIRRFTRRGGRVALEVETGYSVLGIPGTRTWPLEVDADWISVDGKPMLPQRSAPGMAWPSINGLARFVAFEDVETPIGLFRSSWRIVYVDGNGEAGTFWFAPGLGLVKAEFTLSGTRVMALLSQVTR